MAIAPNEKFRILSNERIGVVCKTLMPAKHVIDCEETERIFLETLEVAFGLCNNFHVPFGAVSVLSLFDQIVANAFVQSTAYWVFYQNSFRYGYTACHCRHYGIRCRHVISATKNLLPFALMNNLMFHNIPIYEQVKPQNVLFHVVELNEKFVDILLSFKVVGSKSKIHVCNVTYLLRYEKMRRSMLRQKRYLKAPFTVSRMAPVFHEYYGFYLGSRILKKYNYFFTNIIYNPEIIPAFTLHRTHAFLCVTYETRVFQIPKIPIVLKHWPLLNEMCAGLFASIPKDEDPENQGKLAVVNQLMQEPGSAFFKNVYYIGPY